MGGDFQWWENSLNKILLIGRVFFEQVFSSVCGKFENYITTMKN